MGTPVKNVMAYDDDDGEAGRLTYSFSDHEDLRENHRMFRIDSVSGVITTAATLDRESREEYQVNTLNQLNFRNNSYSAGFISIYNHIVYYTNRSCNIIINQMLNTVLLNPKLTRMFLQIMVVVSDHDTPSNSVTRSLIIKLDDVDDNPPNFVTCTVVGVTDILIFLYIYIYIS